MNVLIVEDEHLTASTLAEILSDDGHLIVGMAGSADKAIRILEERKCDVAILDANLAGSCASPVASAFRKRSIPFVVISGYSQNQLMASLRDAPFVPKPVDAGRLLELIDSMVADACRAKIA